MHSNRTSTTGYGFSWITPGPLNESTQKLFQAIDNENLEDFERAIAEGTDVNTFDEEGMTPLMSVANTYIASSNQPTLKEMTKLLIQKTEISMLMLKVSNLFVSKDEREINLGV
ncbi:Predicted protein [Wolbachia endosymbiont strain TRS of Brugia malayi]|uniref:ankyrin repeat domain-containing protein n=1 Tax=unclassified Wolbachia TaxID=2640676 RepID=UPI00004C9441|nr:MULTISPECIES: ankyrin repeat domain-containing protein [unclassified Wolbachia]AAW71153.1 Predicted protein [Wolbachia endosymbiont strain TRS of Brugia malayi]QIT36302.1 hypothetical protein WBP_0126 [Wolbachia endosymbiont of Brugia pahangi]